MRKGLPGRALFEKRALPGPILQKLSMFKTWAGIQSPITHNRKEKHTMTQSRWKSKVVWAAIAATLLTLLGNLGLYEALGISQEPLKQAVDAALSLLVAFGVLNNPTDAENF